MAWQEGVVENNNGISGRWATRSQITFYDLEWWGSRSFLHSDYAKQLSYLKLQAQFPAPPRSEVSLPLVK